MVSAGITQHTCSSILKCFTKKNAMFEVRYFGLSEGRRKKLSQEKRKR